MGSNIMLTTFKGLELHIKFRYFFLRFSLKMLYNSQWDVLHWEYIRQFEDQVYYGLTEKYPLPSPKDTQSKETTL